MEGFILLFLWFYWMGVDYLMFMVDLCYGYDDCMLFLNNPMYLEDLALVSW